MAGAKPLGAAQPRVAYDGDQKLLAFLGAVAFVIATLFWLLMALRLMGLGSPAAPDAIFAGVASAFVFLPAWGLRAKMQRGARVTRWDVRLLLVSGLALGLGLGGLPYLMLKFKLEDPDFLHLASQPENLPPAAP